MEWRTLLVRTPVVVGLVLAAVVALLYQFWTNPRAVRQMVLDKISETFVGANVRLESAHLRLLGGISFRELRMARRDALEGGDFLYVPSGIIFHDKEHLLDGAMGIRKLELHQPSLRLVRDRSGRLNFEGLLGPTRLDEALPTMVLHQATLRIEDESLAPGSPLLELRQLEITVVNDPLPTVTIEGRGVTDILGPVRFKAIADRPSETVSLELALEAIPLEQDLVSRVARFWPRVGEPLAGLKGIASLDLNLRYDPARSPQPSFELRGRLDRGELHHARLPQPIEHLSVAFQMSNRAAPESLWPRSPVGIYLPSLRIEGKLGSAPLRIEATGIALPDRCDSFSTEDLLATLDCKIEHLESTERVTTALPEHLSNIEPHYQPRGPVSITHEYRRLGANQYQSRWDIKLEGINARFHEVPYPLREIRGTFTHRSSHDQPPVISIDLNGKANGENVRLVGKCTGPQLSEVDLVLSGDSLIAEARLLECLPKKARTLARQFHPSGRFGLEVTIRRPAGSSTFHNVYRIGLRDGKLTYDLFPYPLESVTGELEIETKEGHVRWEARNLRGLYKGAEVLVEARAVAAGERLDQWSASRLRTPMHPTVAQVPIRTVPAVQVRLRGHNVPVDRELEEALAPPSLPSRQPLQKAWQTMNPTGRMNFAAEVVDLPDLPNAIVVSVGLHGCKIQPRFFELPLERVEGIFHYGQNRVELAEIQAHHGEGRFTLPDGVVYLKPNGGFQVRLGRLEVRDMVASPEFIRSLPPVLSKTLELIQLRGVFNLNTALVLETTEGNGPPSVWWDGGMGLRAGAVHLGVEISNITGQISCSGQHNGHTLEVAFGNVLLEQGTILKQPLQGIQATFEVPRKNPDRFQLRNLRAALFGGILAGEGHVRFAPSFQYDLMLKVLQVELAQFGQHNFPEQGAELEGQLGAALHLVGEGTNLSDLRGNGRIDVPTGKLYRLPWMLDLLKTINLQVPDKTAFTQARATFALEGPRMTVQKLELTGKAINLRGNGSLNLDGSNMALDFSIEWGKMLPPGLSDMQRFLSDQLFKIKVRGRLGQVRYERELMPNMIAPIRQAMTGN